MKRTLPIPLLILIDVCLLGAALCVYALFHHVLPQVEMDLSERPQPSQRPPTQIGWQPVTDSDLTDEPTSDHPSDSEPSDSSGVEGTDADESDPPETDPPGPFSAGEVISTDTLYQSEDICVTLTKYSRPYAGEGETPSVFYVQDIYVRYVENLKTAFAKDQYGKNITEWTQTIANRSGAVAAISGDFYGIRSSKGVVIRNGVLYRDNPDEDVLVMYYDGSMEVIAKNAFDGDAAIEQGAYQAWCFGPSLLDENGRAKTEFPGCKITYWNPRSAIGYVAPGHYVFLFAEGRIEESCGLRMETLAQIMEEIGCRVAYNLDGGQSATMIFHDQIVGTPAEGGRPISDIIYIAEIEK